jgi:hypothetical protein
VSGESGTSGITGCTGTTGEPPAGDPGSSTCKDGKLLICHLASTKFAKPENLCVSVEGALKGHGLNSDGSLAPGAHGGDYLGQCLPQ